MSIRLLALDLDGTILDRRLRISPRVACAVRLAQDAGVRVTLASGRFFRSMRLFAKDLGISEPLICYQGALIRDPDTEEVLLHRGVPLHLAQQFIGFVRAHGWDLCVYLDDRPYVDKTTPNLSWYADYSPIKEELTPVGDLKGFLSREPTKIVVVLEAEQAALAGDLLGERFEGHLRVVRSFSRFVEATSLAASKGQALSFLAHKLCVGQTETMAIGDHDNDADMVAWAGLGVAMGGAGEAVKGAADHIGLSIEEDGAAEAIERFILDPRRG